MNDNESTANGSAATPSINITDHSVVSGYLANDDATCDTNTDSSRSFDDIEAETGSSNRSRRIPTLKLKSPSFASHHPTKVVEGEELQQNGVSDGGCFNTTLQKKHILVGVGALSLIVCGIGAIILVVSGKNMGTSSNDLEGHQAFGYITESPTSYPTISPKPTVRPSKQPTPSPTNRPSLSPTPKPSKGPTKGPTVSPTRVPSARPTRVPSARPTPVPPPPTIPPPTFPGMDTFSFYVMGDVPYTESDEKRLRKQLKDIDEERPTDDSLFIVHVGDIFTRRRQKCIRKTYQNVADTFTELSPLPVIVLPGDNDIFDCEDPEDAQALWENSFIGFEQNWNTRSNLPSSIIRQDKRKENFAFVHANVLFLGLNIIGTTSASDRTSDDRYDDCLEWIQQKVGAHTDGSLRSVVFFGHADRFEGLFEEAEEMLAPLSIPTLYIHGNGHKWEMENPIKGWDEYLRVQVDKGGDAPPIKVTIRGTTPVARSSPFFASDQFQHMHGTDVKIDRRGGLY